jgi:glycosyltransferase involved in cell wall biosynthesis
LNDGGAMAMNAMLEGYLDHAWEVYLCSMNTSRHYVSKESLPKLYDKIKFDTFDINTEVKIVPTLKNFFLSKKPNHVDRFYDKDFEQKLKRIISSFEPEVIQIESIYLASYIPVLKEATDAKIVVRLHNIEHEIWERLSGDATSTFKRFYLKDLAARIKRFELQAWSTADILVPITSTDAHLIQTSIPNANIIVAPFGINIESVQRPNTNSKWVGYHIGAMDWLPNVEAISWFLESIWPDLHKEVPEFEFYFAGRNMPGSFEKYESKGVSCEGEVASAKEFIKDKRVLIVPLRSGGGIRIKILEAMASGKLVVSTSIGMQGINEAQPGGHFLLADSEKDFVSQIKWIMKNKEEAESIAKAGASLVTDKYNQRKIMSRLISQMLPMVGPANSKL